MTRIRMRRVAARALADRRGAAAIEYAMLAAGITTVVMTCYRIFFDRASAMINTIIFS